ncbi:MAG: DUF2852 domain-containing protein [Paracoccaceae bacterium]
MNSNAFTNSAHEYDTDQSSNNTRQSNGDDTHFVIQLLSVIAFGVVSIVAVALAFNAFWVAGLLVTAVIASSWSKSRTFSGKKSKPAVSVSIKDLTPTVAKHRTTGNSSFDAYRSDMLQRLEQERRDFDEFLVRLRKASDAKEFDHFMDDRATNARVSQDEIID